MISIKRPDNPPAVLAADSSSRIKAEKKISKIISAGKAPSSKDFDSLWGKKTVRDALWKMQNGRCCYCERYRDVMRESDIEHFRPKTEVLEKSPTKPGYWWLAYEWDNLFFACRCCNQDYKKTRFPVAGTHASEPTGISAEHPDIVDPSKESPEEFIDYDFTTPIIVLPNGRAPNRSRGNKTIEVCGLDRIDLSKQRKAIVPTLQRIHIRMIEVLQSGNPILEARVGKEIADATTSKAKHEFVGMRRAYFKARDLGDYVATD